MAMDDALNGGQPYTGAFKLFRQMQALKNAEQLVAILHVKPGAVVFHEYFDVRYITVRTADLDFGRISHACEFDRVGHKVDDDQPQHRTVSITNRNRADLPHDVPPLRVLREFRNHVPDEPVQINLRLLGLGPPDPGERQQIIDQIAHSFG